MAGVRRGQEQGRRFKHIPLLVDGANADADPVPDPSRGKALILQSEDTMIEPNPTNTFRGLPLTADQASEVEHYIHTHQRSGLPWDTPELQAMIDDMLNPPEVAGDDEALDTCMSAEQATAMGEESGELDLLPCERSRQRGD
jgi:hypothetical protein